MITWPGGRAYSASLQDPKSCFKSKALRGATIKKGAHGEPIGASGQFAVVYKATLADGSAKAVRVFTSERPEMTGRYKAIGDYLKTCAAVKSLVQFEYDAKGIKAIDGEGCMKSFPLVTMEWVPGHELLGWVRTQCDQSNVTKIKGAAERWLNLTQELHSAKIAHGDLQHANVMVLDNGDLKLVDYDCMCVPTLVGKPNLEIGVDPYQHPMRDEKTLLSPNLDNFSTIFIFVALRALAAEPRLWNRFVEAHKYDKLLIRPEDFKEPDKSDLYHALIKSPDSEVGRMSKQLFELYRADIKDVPQLQEMLVSTDMVRTALSKRDFDLAVELCDRIDKLPPDLAQPIQNARERVNRRKELQQAIDAGNEASMQRLYDPRFLDDYPKAQPAVAMAKEAATVIPLLQELRSASQQRRWRELERIWNANKVLLENRKSAADLKVEAGKSHDRNQACDLVLRQFRQPQPDVQSLSQAWKRLVDLGGHPETDTKKTDIDRLIQREQAWAKFLPLVNGLRNEQADIGVVNSWNELLFKDWQKSEPQRPTMVQAKERLDRLSQLKQVVGQPVSEPVEKRIYQFHSQFPQGYQYALADRVQLAGKRVAAYEQLKNALTEPALDINISAAWDTLNKLQGGPMLSRPEQARVQVAESRMPVINKLRGLNQNARMDQFDKRLLDVWQDDVLRECNDTKGWRERYLQARKRHELLAELTTAIAGNDKVAIVKICSHPLFAKYEFSASWGPVIRGAMKEIRQAQDLMAALQAGDTKKFLELFDAACIRNHASFFAPCRERISKLARERLLARKILGLNEPVGLKGVVADRNGSLYLLRWSFPLARFSDKCELTISRKQPETSADLDDLETVFRGPVTRALYEGAGGRQIRVEPGWKGYYITVWAKIDLGFNEFAGEPLVLGRVGMPQYQHR